VLAFYRGRGSTGEGWPGVNTGVNGFNAIEDGGGGVGLRGELRGGDEGGVVTARWHPRRRAGRRGVAERWWRHGQARATEGEGRS
jgi:hypothetical protein